MDHQFLVSTVLNSDRLKLQLSDFEGHCHLVCSSFNLTGMTIQIGDRFGHPSSPKRFITLFAKMEVDDLKEHRCTARVLLVECRGQTPNEVQEKLANCIIATRFDVAILLDVDATSDSLLKWKRVWGFFGAYLVQHPIGERSAVLYREGRVQFEESSSMHRFQTYTVHAPDKPYVHPSVVNALPSLSSTLEGPKNYVSDEDFYVDDEAFLGYV